MAEQSTKTTDKKALSDALTNWETCNDFLRAATEKEAEAMLTMEKGGKRRVQYLLRIYARFNRERARRERSELLKKSGE